MVFRQKKFITKRKRNARNLSLSKNLIQSIQSFSILILTKSLQFIHLITQLSYTIRVTSDWLTSITSSRVPLPPSDLPNNYVFQKLSQPKTGYNLYSTTLKKELLKKEGEEREKSRGNSKTFQLPHPISCVITAPKF